jgi:hypothetical protein
MKREVEMAVVKALSSRVLRTGKNASTSRTIHRETSKLMR